MTGIDRLFIAVEMLRKQVKKDMPSQHISLLLTVSRHLGATMTELCTLLEMPQGTLSRNVKALSSYVDRSERLASVQGLGLLYTEPDKVNHYARRVYLTEAGRAVVDELEAVISAVEVEPDVDERNAEAASFGVDLTAL
ncbi:MAG: MarR family winged helix-turn-helix transcriptional regulator [Geopsychrobacter sp.]|nr:MarR family winged helix-turn-helix transcriptional regulator [Geopsychrobacter sp.]